VHKSVFDQVVDGVAGETRKFKIGPGMIESTNLGPLVSQEQLSRVCGFLDSGNKEGATTIVGGHRIGDAGYFVEPTILVDVKPHMKVVREEIFGPVVTAIPFTEPEEVVAFANDTVYGLASAVWTRDISKAHRMAAKLRAGTVWINCYNVFDPALPFGGYKQSGWGRENGRAALDLYTENKSVCAQI
jgi:phenylacetaldehyde dehydrogenase